MDTTRRVRTDPRNGRRYRDMVMEGIRTNGERGWDGNRSRGNVMCWCGGDMQQYLGMDECEETKNGTEDVACYACDNLEEEMEPSQRNSTHASRTASQPQLPPQAAQARTPACKHSRPQVYLLRRDSPGTPATALQRPRRRPAGAAAPWAHTAAGESGPPSARRSGGRAGCTRVAFVGTRAGLFPLLLLPPPPQ